MSEPYRYGEPWELHTQPDWDTCVIGPQGAMAIRTQPELGKRIVACINALWNVPDDLVQKWAEQGGLEVVRNLQQFLDRGAKDVVLAAGVGVRPDLTVQEALEVCRKWRLTDEELKALES